MLKLCVVAHLFGFALICGHDARISHTKVCVVDFQITTSCFLSDCSGKDKHRHKVHRFKVCAFDCIFSIWINTYMLYSVKPVLYSNDKCGTNNFPERPLRIGLIHKLIPFHNALKFRYQ